MAGFESTSLWQSTLAKQLIPDNLESEREFFRVHYEQFRENAGLLAGEISRDLPDYTVHDITHLDALWEMASIICGKDYTLNPAESFVLGGAFLIHDLGMGLAAYPDGVEALKSTSLWADTVAYLNKQGKGSTDVEKQATEIVLRALHAKHAEQLALVFWGAEERFYLIENQKLREAYGAVIGVIAHSHWWNSDELLKRLPPNLGALADMPNSWGVDVVKLACIMRVADAAHIDSRRAPAILKAFRRPNEYAQQHWLFQQRLYQPRIEAERLVYTSKSSFAVKEAKSWWLCFDTLKMIDQELRDVDSILGDSKRARFEAKGVAAINDIRSLLRLVSVEGWYPIDTRVHVGNVAKLVKNLGGEQLYGRNGLVPLRELIQNSCDAIRARRFMENEPPEWGKVTVRAGEDANGKFIEVEDEGVGMSVGVLAGPFLDFGSSFWGTSMMHGELPGLESKGFKSTGRYGVGFFSVFMWGDTVKVTTRRYESARQDTKVLSFDAGLSERPILRSAEESEYIKNGGTRVRVYFSSGSSFQEIFRELGKSDLDLGQVLEGLCPCLDTNLNFEDLISGQCGSVIKANDWKTLEGEDLIKRSLGSRTFNQLSSADRERLLIGSKNARDVFMAGDLVGRGYITPVSESTGRLSVFEGGLVSVGGFRTSGLRNIIGFFIGEASRASRDIGIPKAEGDPLIEWVNEQARFIGTIAEPEESKETASIIRALGGLPNNLIVARHSNGHLTSQELEILLADAPDEILIVSDSGLSLLERAKSGKVELLSNVFSSDPGYPSILQANSFTHEFWPSAAGWFHSKTLQGFIIEIFAMAHGFSIEEVMAASDFDSDEVSHERVIGAVRGEEVALNVDIIRIPRKS